MRRLLNLLVAAMAATALANAAVHAHGPLFSPAPETIFKGGTEITLGFHTEKATGAGEEEKAYELFLEAEYGITADWEIGIEIPYAWKEEDGGDADGIGDIVLDTKYQFWKRDLPLAQYKAAAFLQLKLPTGDDDSTPRLGSGSTDVIAGLATGYESRRWYWFASGVYRVNTEGVGEFCSAEVVAPGTLPIELDHQHRVGLVVLAEHRPHAADDVEELLVALLEAGWPARINPNPLLMAPLLICFPPASAPPRRRAR